MIRNATKNTVLHTRPAWATTTWQHAKGFMFSTPGDRAIVFLFMPARKISLHMFFVFGPIDCVALDGSGTVIALKEQFLPWTVWRERYPASAVIELPAGTVKQTKTEIGDRVTLPRPPL